MKQPHHLLILLTFILALPLSVAGKKRSPYPFEDKFLFISQQMSFDPEQASNVLDSVEMMLDYEESEKYMAYVNFSHSLIKYRNGNYREALKLLDVALERFMYDEQDDWVARCLVQIGFVAEIERLIPEAINAYTLALTFATDKLVIGSANLGLARNNMRLKREWQSYLAKGVDIFIHSGDENYATYAHFISYWFYQDSIDLVPEMKEVAAYYHRKGMYKMEAGSYKIITFHYRQVKNYDDALQYIDKSIEAYEKASFAPKAMISSAYHLKGQLLMYSDRYEEALVDVKHAIKINLDANLGGNNYQLYKYLYQIENSKGHYEHALVLSEKMVDAYENLSKLRMARYIAMSEVFYKVKYVGEKLKTLRKEARLRTLSISFLIGLLSMVIISYLLVKKRYFERKSDTMESNNNVLKEEAGELLYRFKQDKIVAELIQSQIDFERKAAKYLKDNDELPQILKERYAETFLIIGSKFPQLSDSERRFAALFALGIRQKDIAELLNVQALSVAQYRNRIRKKMGISNTDLRLEDFLQKQV